MSRRKFLAWCLHTFTCALVWGPCWPLEYWANRTAECNAVDLEWSLPQQSWAWDHSEGCSVSCGKSTWCLGCHTIPNNCVLWTLGKTTCKQMVKWLCGDGTDGRCDVLHPEPWASWQGRARRICRGHAPPQSFLIQPQWWWWLHGKLYSTVAI